MFHGIFSVFGVFAALLLLVCGVAVLPALLAVGAVVLAFTIAFAVLGVLLRLLGVVLMAVFALPLILMFGVAFALGVAILHAALPLLLIVGVVWLILHHRRHTPQALPSPSRAP